jgi:hypothetical protein
MLIIRPRILVSTNPTTPPIAVAGTRGRRGRQGSSGHALRDSVKPSLHFRLPQFRFCPRPCTRVRAPTARVHPVHGPAGIRIASAISESPRRAPARQVELGPGRGPRTGRPTTFHPPSFHPFRRRPDATKFLPFSLLLPVLARAIPFPPPTLAKTGANQGEKGGKAIRLLLPFRIYREVRSTLPQSSPFPNAFQFSCLFLFFFCRDC